MEERMKRILSLGRYEVVFRKKPKQKFKRKDLINIYLTKQQLRKKVKGCLKNTCDNHPEIPTVLIGSATKRIVGQICGVNGIPEDMIEE